MADVWSAIVSGTANAIEFLDDHQGALMVLTTVAYAVLTLLLYTESRAARLSAVVVAWAERWRWNEGVMAVYLENIGPAPARSVELGFDWRRPDGSARVPIRIVRHAALAPGQRLSFGPDTLLPEEVGRGGMDGPAGEGLVLRLSWSWSDGRRPLWRRGERRQQASLDVDAATFRDSVSGEPNVLEPEPMDPLVRALNDAVDRQERRRWLNSNEGVPPEVRVHLEAARFRERLAMWRERFRYWVLRRR